VTFILEILKYMNHWFLSVNIIYIGLCICDNMEVQTLSSFLKETGQFQILRKMITSHKKSEGCKKNWESRRLRYATQKDQAWKKNWTAQRKKTHTKPKRIKLGLEDFRMRLKRQIVGSNYMSPDKYRKITDEEINRKFNDEHIQ